MSQPIILNKTGNPLSYINGQIAVAANSQTSVPYGLIPYLATDAQFVADISSIPLVVTVSDGMTEYTGPAAQDYINQWIAGGPPQNSSDPVAFTLAGMGFSITADATLTSSTETPLLLLKNPSNATVNSRAMFFYAATDNSSGIITIRVYTNPTVTANGATLPISNNLVQAGVPSSLMTAYASPTISANGTKRITLVSVANGNTDLLNFAQTAILAPGNTMLITVSVTNLGLLASALTHFYLQWAEV